MDIGSMKQEYVQMRRQEDPNYEYQGALERAYREFSGERREDETNLENINFQKETNLENWEHFLENRGHVEAREDNAVQRRINDLQSAGLSPLLSAGASANSGGGGAPPSMGAPSVRRDPDRTKKMIGSIFQAVMQGIGYRKSLQDIKNADRQQKNLDDLAAATVRNINAKTEDIDYRQKFMSKNHQLSMQRLGLNVRQYKMALDKMRTDIANMPLRRKHMKAQIALARINSWKGTGFIGDLMKNAYKAGKDIPWYKPKMWSQKQLDTYLGN